MKNKIALVTGGTSGIGKEIVKELLDKECIVITCYLFMQLQLLLKPF